MIEIMLLISILFLILGIALIIFVNKKNEKKIGLRFKNTYLILSDKTEIFYKKIINIAIKSIYVSGKGWEPRILVSYQTPNQVKQFVIKTQFYPRPNYIGELFEKDYEHPETVLKLRRFMPEKIDDLMNKFLNNENIKFEDLESMDKMVGVEMIKPRGSFRLRD